MHQLVRFVKWLAVLGMVLAVLYVVGIPLLQPPELSVAPAALDEAPQESEASLPDGLLAHRLAYQFDERTGSVVVYALTNDAFATRVFYDAAPRFVSAWGGGADRVVINGGFFHEDYSPSGFLIAEGERIGVRQFDEARSGVVVVRDGTVSIEERVPAFSDSADADDGAIQSFPFLVRAGHAAVSEDSGLLSRRSAIGTDANGTVYLIFAQRGNISLYELAQTLAASEFPFDTVLNLDGGPSSGLYVQVDEYADVQDSLSGVPSVLVFER